jgi:hypothetical protein
MEPTQEPIDDIYRERVLQARRMHLQAVDKTSLKTGN